MAVVGDRVYFGSPVDHQVRCLDLQSGKEIWHLFTDAPVRLAPSVADGRVYVGSDDGFTYGLDAESGNLVWKRRGGPANEWILARGKMISRWPVRTSVLVDGGVAYLGAGIFPHENVYACAARTQDGTILWRNDNSSHMDAGRNDLSPQGYLLATEDVLYVPSGRSRPKAVSRLTGELTEASSSSLSLADTAIAGTEALIADGRLQLYSLGTRLVIVGDISYAATGNEVMRLNRKEFAAAPKERSQISTELRDLSSKLPKAGDEAPKMRERIAELKKRAQEIADAGIVWRTPSKAQAGLIVAGELVFAGGLDSVTALETVTGKEIWNANVEGSARGLAVASGNLLVSATTGKVYCFANAKPAGKASATVPATENPFPDDQWTAVYQRAAEEILENTGVKRGYCLVVGSEQGRLAFELARRSELKIYAVEPDEAKVRESRQRLSAAGLYGHRITVHCADLDAIPYSNYFANLTREHPITGEAVPWSVMRPGHHCGMLTASDNMLLFRSGFTGFFDLESDSGTSHFAGHRLGCWINAIPTNGLVVIPEASAGRVCIFSIASTIVMEPRETRRSWSLNSGIGPTTPVKQMSLNLGAPGDRRDRNGKLWLAYPRPVPNPRLETSLDLKLTFDTGFQPGGASSQTTVTPRRAVRRSWPGSFLPGLGD